MSGVDMAELIHLHLNGQRIMLLQDQNRVLAAIGRGVIAALTGERSEQDVRSRYENDIRATTRPDFDLAAAIQGEAATGPTASQTPGYDSGIVSALRRAAGAPREWQDTPWGPVPPIGPDESGDGS